MVRKALVGAVVAVVLALPAVAIARPRLADKQYVQYQLVHHYLTSDGQNIDYARCKGDFSGPHKWKFHEWLLHNFNCREVDDVSRIFGVAVAIHRNGSLGVVEYGCNDSYSNYYCPSTLPPL